MNRSETVSFHVSAVLAVMLPAVACVTARGAVTTFVDVDYHYQRYNNWCASASTEMILSSPAVKNNNAFVADMLAAPDDPGRSPAQPRLLPTFVNTPLGVNTSRNPQAFLYGLKHGVNSISNNGNTRTYLNPLLPYGKGGDTLGITTALSLLDTPNFQGAGVPQGKHTYTGWNLAPNIRGAALATRQIASSLQLTGVAAQATVGSGAHALVVNGVTTDVAITPNGNYNITGVIVSDPWTGFVQQQKAAGLGDPGGGDGFGINAWVPHGYDIIPGAATLITLPDGSVVPGRYKKWTKSFNVAPANPGAVVANPAVGGLWGTPGVQFVTASSSEVNGNNVPLETGGGGNFYSLVGSVLHAGGAINNAAAALAAAQAALAANPALAGVFPGPAGVPGGGGGPAGLPGNFVLADAVFIPDPNPLLPGDGDWLLPYLPTGETTDFSGAIMIDSLTGEIDMALFTPDASFDYQLPELTEIFSEINQGIFPSSGFEVPEPGAMAILAPGLVLLVRRRR